jgi:DNA repair protein RecN (Recombination protein N)
MLRELSVQNLALIEDVRVELQPGYCAWTGETGAGKSLLLGALGLLLGDRGSADLLRSGAEELQVTGLFDLDRPEERATIEQVLNRPIEDDQIILSRRLTSAGRSYAYVNDQSVMVGTLRQIGSILVDIHGQRENQSLLEPAYQLQLLDAFGDLQVLRQKYLATADRMRDWRKRHSQLTADRERRQRDLALLRFEREELTKAELRPGEMAELAQERERLAHAQSLQSFAAQSCELLYDQEGSVVEQIGKLHREAEAWLAVDGGLESIAQRLQGLSAEVQDVAETLRAMAQKWEADPARLEQVEERLQLLRRLETKYGKPINDLIAYVAGLDDQEKRLQLQEDNLSEVATAMSSTFAELTGVARELSKQRKKTAKKFVAQAQIQLTDLGMSEAKLDAVLDQVELGADATTAEVPADGIDRLDLLLAANKGEPSRPLRKVASGGEMSRTMLALKTVLAAHDRVGTLVFDEIDSNVGGRLGDVLGQKLAALGQTHQVICVTHLPQVASFARHQWTIRKSVRGDRTTTTIHFLDAQDRLEELASMLRGEARGETTRKEAAAMLAAAKRSW